MGTVRLNRLKDYWKTSRFFDFKCVRQVMSRDRFLLILRCLHFCSGSSQDCDRLHKVRPIIDYFNNKMREVYYPGKELSLDEGMVLWRGRLVFRQYIKNKRHKYGMKIYALTEPSGLVTNFTIYSGKGGDLSGKGHASKVVKFLMRGKFHKGHSLYMDNYYNSFGLASELLRKGTYCTGTFRQDRKHFPADLKAGKLKKGEKMERYAEGVMMGKWRDKRVVHYISTEHENTMGLSYNRRREAREKPVPIIYYNANMKGVDRNDQMMAYYPCDHKSLRWYKKVFVHVLQMLMINSFRLFKFGNPDETATALYDFRLSVIDALLPATEEPTPPAKRPRQNEHLISKITKLDKLGRIVAKRCRVCYQGGKRKETVYVCAQCPGEPGLCALACFEKFHAQ